MSLFMSNSCAVVANEKQLLRAQAISDGTLAAEKQIAAASINSTDEYLGATGSSLNLSPRWNYPNEFSIQTSLAPQIVENIRARRPGWTATAVISSYIKQAAVAQELTNCLTEGMYTVNSSD
jgi:anti-sigma factor RsiW